MLLFSVQQIRTAGRLVISVERLEQCRLSSTVLTKERQHFAAECLEADIVQRFYARKIFRNVLKLQNSSHFVSSCCLLTLISVIFMSICRKSSYFFIYNVTKRRTHFIDYYCLRV